MNQAQLEARELIRELIATYAHLGDRGRIDELVELFHEDATIESGGTTYAGRQSIGRFFGGIVSDRSAAPSMTYVRHHVASVTITLEDDSSAFGASYWTVYSDNGFESSGRYRDTYRRAHDGRWRFQSRTIRRDEPRVIPSGSQS